MDHVFGFQIGSWCGDGSPRRKGTVLGTNLSAFCQQRWPGSPMNRAIHTASPEQAGIGCVHDRISGFIRDVANDQIERSVADPISLTGGLVHLSVSASTPGSFLPSKNSSDAPPPVEMCVILSATPASCTAATQSPPPPMHFAPCLPALPCPISL